MTWGWIKAIGGFFAGGGKTAEKVVEMADEAVMTRQEATEIDQKDLSDARAMQQFSHSSWFDILIDGFSRLVRPGMTLWIIGGFTGWWKLPRVEEISEYWQNVFMILLTFWFGGRAILKDLPSAIRAMRGK